jgi:hypothetical protein
MKDFNLTSNVIPEESQESEGLDHDFPIIDFISRNPACNKEEVVKGTGDLSRVPTLRRLKKLIDVGVIRTEAKGAKYRNKLYVSKDDPFSSVCIQINSFQRDYFILLDKVITLVKKRDSKIWTKFKKKYGHEPTKQELEELLFNSIVLFQMMVHTYTLRSIFEWPQKMERDYLLTLNGMVFQKISELYIETYDRLRFEKVNVSDNTIDEALKQIYPQEFIESFRDPFEDFDLFEDLKKVGFTGAIKIFKSKDVVSDEDLKKMSATWPHNMTK